MSPYRERKGWQARARRACLAASLLALAPFPAGALGPEAPAAASAASAAGGVRRGRQGRAPSAEQKAVRWRERHALYFQRNWGVDIVGVRRVASGSMLRFDYRVVDPTRAAVLADPKVRPFLIDEATRTALAVPAMEKVGELRQVAALETRRTYFMIFGNPGGLVKHGGRVSLVVGTLRAEGLVVD